MPLIIDGHNLIPKVPGFSLKALDDEQELVDLLQEYCRLIRKQAEIYFDNSPPGQPRARNFGNVTARYIHESSSADEAIKRKLTRLGGAARNWTVVSSDRQVQAAARSAHAKVIPSEEFALMIINRLDQSERGIEEKENNLISEEELEDWLNLFGDEGKDS
jgi:predicted RNA-binding protein with PIN domain